MRNPLAHRLDGLAETWNEAEITRPALGLPGVNYVGGSRQLHRRVGAPTPLPWQGGGPRFCWGLLAGN